MSWWICSAVRTSAPRGCASPVRLRACSQLRSARPSSTAMNRSQLEHILRAAAAIVDERDIVVVGSQAILGQFPDASATLLASIEADVFPRHASAKSILIDGAIGELSTFHQTFGYYAHGVDETTATLPPGWQERLVPIRN